MKRLWVTGYRAYELAIFKDDDPKVKVIKNVLRANISDALNQSEEEFWLISGPQMGVERWAIEVGLQLKKDYQQLKVAIMTPYQNVSQRWNEENQSKLALILNKVDFTAAVSNQSYQNPQQLRNYQSFMLQHSDGALVVYDPDVEDQNEQHSKPYWDYRAIKNYQSQGDYDLRVIDFDQLQEAAQEMAESGKLNS